MNKKLLVLIIAAVLLMSVGVGAWLWHDRASAVCHQGFSGTCLPKGQCMNGADNVVDCETGKPIEPS